MAFQDDTASDQSLWSLLARRWKALLIAFVLTAIAATALLHRLPARYEATAKLLIMKTDQRMGGLQVVNNAIPELSDTSNPLFTQVELLRIMPVFQAVIAELDMQGGEGRPLEPQALAQQVKVTPIDKTDLITVSYVSKNPLQAQKVVASLCETYLRYAEQYRMEGVRDGFKLVDEQLASAKKRMLDAENRLLDFKEKSGTLALPEEIHASVNAIANLNGEIRARQIDLARARARAASLRGQLGMSAQQAMKAAAIAQSPRVRALQEQLVAAESSPLRSQGLGSSHPEVVALDQRIAQLRQAISAEIGTAVGKGGPSFTLDEVRLGQVRELAATEVELAANAAALSAAESRRLALAKSHAGLPSQEIQLARLSREASVASEIYQQLLEKREAARLNMAMAPAYVRIIEPAEVPLTPNPPLKGLGFPLILFGSLGAAMGFAAVKDMLDRPARPQALAAALPDLKLFAAIPHLSRGDRARGELIMRSGSNPAYMEAVRTLACALEERLEHGAGVVAFTSSQAREGKSVTLSNVAIAMGDAGKKVLVVDLDLRRPRIREVFGLGVQRLGLTDVLLGHAEPFQVIRQHEGIDIVSAGTTPIAAGHMRLPQRLAPALEAWREAYDVILLDLPPLVIMSEVVQVGRLADGMVMLGNLDEVAPEVLAGGIQQLNAFNVPLLGVAVICKMIGTPKRGYYLIAGEGLVQ